MNLNVTLTTRCETCVYFERLDSRIGDEGRELTGYCHCWDYGEGENPNVVHETDFCSQGALAE